MNILKECEDAKVIGISGHVRPDGDCIGSCCALYLYLKKVFPQKEIYIYLEKPSDIFHDIKGVSVIDSSFSAERKHDVFFVMDTPSDRIGGAVRYYEQADKKINIDHHISNKGESPISIIDSTASATAEVLFGLLEDEKLDVEIAKALYIGIMHDTGVFQYANTTPKTLQIVSRLISFEFDFSKLIEVTFYQRTFMQTKLLARALEECKLIFQDRVSLCKVSHKIMQEFGAVNADLEGIVNQILNIKGVDCAIFFHELAEGEYKLSLRSNEKVNVSKVAVAFAGGGHIRAAGCTLHGDYEDCLKKVMDEIEKQL